MKNTFLLSILLALILSGCKSDEKTSPRERINFDNGWTFAKGDHAKAYEAAFDDSSWQRVALPHDWSITDRYDKDNPSGPRGGYAAGGIGWYRKVFRLDNADRNAKVNIEFDGVYMNSEVWINGHYLGKRPYGFISFAYDLTPYLHWEGKNLLAVKVDNSKQPNARWYTGSGIYRHVQLLMTGKLHVDRHGLVVSSDTDGKEVCTTIHTVMKNEYRENRAYRLTQELYSAEGEKVASAHMDGSVGAQETDTLQMMLNWDQPRLWSPESPYLYTLKTRIVSDDKLADSMETKVGVRTVCFDKNHGFYLNGKPMKLQGMNEHSDLGALGAAVNEQVMTRRLKILKEMGCNAIRTAHNPPSKEFLALCDEMGFMVMDEAFDEWIESWPYEKSLKHEGKIKYGYHLYFDEWAEKDLTELIQRDRNHASVILWSVGNEVPDACYEAGIDRLKRLKAVVDRHDGTRLVTCGITHIHLANASGFASELDVTGYNGGGGSCFMYEKDRKTYPDRIFVATEVPHSFQTRGIYRTKSWYRDKNPLGGIKEVPDLTEEEVFTEVSPYHSSSYDNAMVRINARDSWAKTRELPYMAGEFRWTGFDYLGESLLGWPARSWNFGIIDRCGFPKDTYYFYQSQWTTTPMVHVLPHWNWAGKEGVTIPVMAYSNCEKVELFVNGKSLGEQEMKGRTEAIWMVPYERGELLAEGKNAGRVCCSKTIRTASDPARIVMTADRSRLTANQQDVVHVEVSIVDREGNFVPTANNRITFETDGGLKIIGIDNGDPLNADSFAGNAVNAFNGRCLLILKAEGRGGKAILRGTSPGLDSAETRFTTEC